MPSVDVIRNVTIKGKADGVDDATAALNRLTASIQAANDNLAKSRAMPQDNNEAFRITGLDRLFEIVEDESTALDRF